MPVFTRTRRAIVPAATLLFAIAKAQKCYYPDGKTTSNDAPCDPTAPASACCGSDSFCLVGGLCYGGGMVMRGSCTDKSWKSASCPSVCTSEEKSAEIAITPCASGGSSNIFVCGVNNTDCQTDSNTFSLSSDTSIVLRPAQQAALVQSSLQSSTSSSSTATVTAIPAGYFSGGAMAGLAIGIALPLLIALGIMYMLLRKERNKFGNKKPSQKLMYQLPDDEVIDDSPHTPSARSEQRSANRSANNSTNRSNNSTPTQAPIKPSASLTAAFQSNRDSDISAVTSMATSPRVSMRTIQTMSSRPVVSQDFPPNQSQTFLERYEAMKRAAAVQSMEVGVEGVQVPGIPGTPSVAPGTPGTPGSETPGTPVPQELDSKETGEKVRYELSDQRMST